MLIQHGEQLIINTFGNPDLLRDRQINFKPHFNEGDTVKVRLEFSDDLTVGGMDGR